MISGNDKRIAATGRVVHERQFMGFVVRVLHVDVHVPP